MSSNNMEKFIKLANPNEYGVSRKVLIKKLELNGLGLGNGGSWCRESSALGRKYNVKRHKYKNRIVAVQLCGYNKNPAISNSIPQWIREDIKNKRCAILATGKVECDHKDGRKNDPRFNNPRKVYLDDFQPLSKPANVAKRRHCQECRKTNNRFNAMRLGYSIPQWTGNGIYIDTCVGCYWHDPLKFNEEVSKRAKKE